MIGNLRTERIVNSSPQFFLCLVWLFGARLRHKKNMELMKTFSEIVNQIVIQKWVLAICEHANLLPFKEIYIYIYINFQFAF